MKRIGVDPKNWRWFNQDYSEYAVIDPEVVPDTVVKDKPRGWLKIGAGVLCILAFGLIWAAATNNAYPNPAAYITSAIVLFSAVTLSFFFLRWIGWLASAGILALAVWNFMSGKQHDSILVAGTMALLATGYALIKWSKPVKGSVTVHPQPKDLLWNAPEKRVFGTAGLIAGAADVFGKEAVEAGARGERSTAKLLDLLMKIPGTVVFHGLRFPGSQKADVDHAVAHGDFVFLIDSKQYRAGVYEWGDWDYTYDDDPNVYTKEVIYRDGNHVIENSMDVAAEGYREMLPEGVTVIPIVLIHGYNVAIGNRMTSAGGVHLLTPNDAMEYIGSTLGDSMDQWQDERVVRTVLLSNLK